MTARPRDRATVLLRLALRHGPLPEWRVAGMARAHGIPARTLRRARADLGVRAVRRGGIAGNGTWWLALPHHPEPDDPAPPASGTPGPRPCSCARPLLASDDGITTCVRCGKTPPTQPKGNR